MNDPDNPIPSPTSIPHAGTSSYSALDFRKAGKDKLSEFLVKEKERLNRLIDARLPKHCEARFSKSDVIQDTYLRATNSLKYINKDENLPAFVWIRKICLETLKQLIKSNTTNKRATSMESRAVTDSIMMGNPSPRSKMIRDERKNQILRAMQELKGRDKEILNMFYIENLTLREITYVLEISYDNVKQRFSRAVRRLRAQIEGEVMDFSKSGLPDLASYLREKGGTGNKLDLDAVEESEISLCGDDYQFLVELEGTFRSGRLQLLGGNDPWL